MNAEANQAAAHGALPFEHGRLFDVAEPAREGDQGLVVAFALGNVAAAVDA